MSASAAATLGVVDCEGVARWAGESLPNVTVARENKFMCSSLGQEMIEKDIHELGLNRVVVAPARRTCTRPRSGAPASAPG
jgi:heterodisulfide reductase subunit A-like polyferredoxin